MVFSSITFLFFFLPAVLILYLLAGKKGRNVLLLLASLVFYAWGEGVYLLLMLASISLNYSCGRAIHALKDTLYSRLFCILAVVLNLLILGFFKYANFLATNLNMLFGSFDLPSIDIEPIRLPIGISFFTFQALSYIIDVYREKVPPQKNLINLGLYIALFPQLIAGPIVRYHDIAKEIAHRQVTLDGMATGVQRFLFGLSKKVLLANPLAMLADTIFTLPESELTTPVAWLGAACYTLQIYFDFSGYSDMAIGLGRMFGFHFLENFNYPYISKSIQEFWRRWHISLSTWFRDYLYIPLGGSRRGSFRTYLNLLIVFSLCGFWHGANWTFGIWGLYHGLFLIIERTPLGRLQRRMWSPLQIIYTLIIIMIGWVFFRCETLSAAIHYIAVMFGDTTNQVNAAPISSYLDSKIRFELCAAILLAMPLYPAILKLKKILLNHTMGPPQIILESSFQLSKLTICITLMYFSFISLAAGVYNPFIYFRF